MVRELVVLWDIDGTLLDTQGAGVMPLTESIELTTGSKVALDRRRHAGKSDYEIIETLSGLSLSNQSEEAKFEKILQDYVNGLAANLKKKPVVVLGDVVNTLAYLNESPNVRVGLLTGNCQTGGKQKLISAELIEYFEPTLSFFSSFTLSNRASVLASAVENHTNMVIVGDTPNDVEAGLKHNIPVISVATGQFSLSELEQINRGLVLNENWKMDDFSRLLETVLR